MLKHWSSEAPQSALAPTWRIPFFETTLADTNLCRALRTAVEQHRADIMSLPAGSDGNTGLGTNSLTSRFQKYNLLAWDDAAINQLRRRILMDYHGFLESLGLDRRRVFVQCWANVLAPGKFLGRHVHTTGPWS
jgi:hypothetical protein